jgi:DNA polymerase-3 subunit delta
MHYITAMPKPVDALDYLANPGKHSVASVGVLFGDEAFLKRLVLAELKQAVLSGDDAEFSVDRFTGAQAELRDVTDALATRALFGGGRHMVVIDEADPFVSAHRAELEDYVAKPRSSSVLVLDVVQWPATTRLYKALAESGLMIECKFPASARLAKWLTSWAKKHHGAVLEPQAAELLAETLESDLGLFDQELAKLSATVGAGGTIAAALVDEVVRGWRAKSAWDMLDRALDGDMAEALVQLDRLLIGGEVPIALLAQISATLRRMASAAQIVVQAEATRRSMTLRHALEKAGVKPFVINRVEPQMRRLGRQRAGQLYRWLLEADLALKGTSSSPARSRLVLEELIVRIAQPERAAVRK